MEISKYVPETPPKHIRSVMNDLIIMQKYRDFTYERPIINTNVSLEKPVIQYEAYEKQVREAVSSQMKTKIIKKLNREKIDVKRQKKALKVFNLYLLQTLNISAVESVHRNQPLPMSLLDSKDQGDYLPDGDKKDHPHYSNTIKLTEIPNEQTKGFLPQIRKREKIHFQQQDICVLKIKQFKKFIYHLFRQGNEQFEGIAQKIGLSTSSTKLLYDLCNDYFRVENSLDIKSQEMRKKVSKKIIKFASKAFEKYKNRQNVQSSYISLDEEFVSLRDIRHCFTAVLDEQSSSDSGK